MEEKKWLSLDEVKKATSTDDFFKELYIKDQVAKEFDEAHKTLVEIACELQRTADENLDCIIMWILTKCHIIEEFFKVKDKPKKLKMFLEHYNISLETTEPLRMPSPNDDLNSTKKLSWQFPPIKKTMKCKGIEFKIVQNGDGSAEFEYSENGRRHRIYVD